MKFRLSKKFLFILGGVLVIGAGSGGAAVFVGRDRLLGTEAKDESNGLACTTLNTITSRQNGQVWVRRYITADDSGDGMVRLKTALRVAHVLQGEKKADLVQVAMVDPHGPKDRADIRGRSIGAQVVYIPDPAKMPKGVQAANYAAYYYQGAAGSDGDYYGMRIDLPLEDVEKLSAGVTGGVDCVDPAAEAARAAEAAAQAASADAAKRTEAKEIRKREMRAKMEGEATGQKPGEEGAEAKPAEVKEEAPAAAAKEESGGLISSISGMIFGSKPEEAKIDAAKVEAAKVEAGKPEVAAAAAAPSQDHASGGAAGAGEQAASGHKPAADDKSSAQQGGGHIVAADAAPKDGVKAHAGPADAGTPAKAETVAEQPADQGIFASIRGMIFGRASEDKAPVEVSGDPAKAGEGSSGKSAADSAKPAAGGKGAGGAMGAGNALAGKADAAGHKPAANPNAETPAVAKSAEGKPVVQNASAEKSDADAAGSAWLAKFRAQQAPASP
ncbi:MAG: hypothetical protein PW791_05085 [Neorhizobium sp.]|nr:hypothetical protein [Neorhizobium sp.]